MRKPSRGTCRSDPATAAVLSHGLVNERGVPSGEIDAAIERRRKFVADAAKHTHREP